MYSVNKGQKITMSNIWTIKMIILIINILCIKVLCVLCVPDDVAAEGGKVLVHCRAGVSRSATVCIAYLMHKQGISLDAAFDQVLVKRPVIDPNLNFIQQLQRFETELKENPAITVSPASISQPELPKSASLFTFPNPAHPSPLCSVTRFGETPMETQNLQRLAPSQRIEQMYSCQDKSPKRLKIDHVSSSALVVSSSTELSPSSLSQTAASPNPAHNSAHRSRPASLPLQLNRASYDADPEQGSTPESLMKPFSPAVFSPPPQLSNTDFSGVDSFSVPKTPSGLDQSFSFFNSDLPFPAVASTSMSRSNTYLGTTDTNSSRSPFSPIPVPLSPLPPLPSS